MVEDTNDYFEKMNLKMDDDICRMKTAFKIAHDIRKFEIDLFWRRGTYYWAFILASFTAFFFVLTSDFCSKELYKQFYLCLTSFFGFFFSWLWVYINKGSKFWQKNWETHIDKLESYFSGDLYKVFLNTKIKDEFKDCMFSLEPYDYSVSKITTFGAIVLAVISGINFCIQVIFFVIKIVAKFEETKTLVEFWVLVICIIILSIFFISLRVWKKLFYGNKEEQQKRKESRFVKRES